MHKQLYERESSGVRERNRNPNVPLDKILYAVLGMSPSLFRTLMEIRRTHGTRLIFDFSRIHRCPYYEKRHSAAECYKFGKNFATFWAELLKYHIHHPKFYENLHQSLSKIVLHCHVHC